MKGKKLEIIKENRRFELLGSIWKESFDGESIYDETKSANKFILSVGKKVYLLSPVSEDFLLSLKLCN